jgi:hypothetical protein
MIKRATSSGARLSIVVLVAAFDDRRAAVECREQILGPAHERFDRLATDQRQISFTALCGKQLALAFATHEWNCLPSVEGPDRDFRL